LRAARQRNEPVTPILRDSDDVQFGACRAIEDTKARWPSSSTAASVVLPHTYYIVFGAAVRPDGRPSGTLARRIEGAIAASRTARSPMFLVTGGQGRFGPPEADVMHDILVARGIPATSILRDVQSHDTMSSAINCAQILRDQGDFDRVFVCTSPYHIPRCRLLFKLLGIATLAAPMPTDLPGLGMVKLTYYGLRELVAIPIDIFYLWYKIIFTASSS
jgi:uncharacterized SAM-binding protein YcdF (DUF218 family)